MVANGANYANFIFGGICGVRRLANPPYQASQGCCAKLAMGGQLSLIGDAGNYGFYIF
jgi:hypothetical protein